MHTTPVPETPRAGFRADVQGLRAVAVGIVVAYHAGFAPMAGGFVGVDVFFVISGFLITQHIVRELDRTGRVSLPAFYARRIRRILPAAAVVAVATLVAAVVLLSPLRVVEVARDAIATALLVPNLWFAWVGTDYLSATDPSPFQHYWSLGVEEQFYLLWPGLLLLVALVTKSRRALPIVMAAVAVVSFVVAQAMLATSPTWTYFSLHTRAWEFAIGGLVGLALLRTAAPIGAPRVRAGAGWLGLALIVVPTFLYDESTPFPGALALVPVAGTALILTAGGSDTRFGVSRALGLRPLVFIGLVSYSIYLLHWPALNLAAAVNDGTIPVPILAAILLALVPAAWLLHTFVEKPFIASPALSRRRPSVYFAAGAGVAVLSIVLSVGVTATLTTDQADSNRAVESLVIEPTAEPTAEAKRGAPEAGPEVPDFVPSNLSPSLAAAKDDLPVLYGSGCHSDPGDHGWDDCRYGSNGSTTTIALFGDSHAANWFPALDLLAGSEDFELRSFTKSWCASADVTTLVKGDVDETCGEWRESVLDELVASPPDLVILGNYTSAPKITQGEWEKGLTTIAKRLAPVTTVVFMADLADFSESPPQCLSGNLDSALECAEPADEVIDRATNSLMERVASDNGALYLDLSETVCPDGTCPAILGNVLTYRDTHHFTATFSESLAPALWAGIEPLLPDPTVTRASN